MIKVLIVEDDPMVAEFIRRFLEKVEGFALVASARSANEALAILDRAEVNLILLDIFMPGINGLEFLVSLRKKEQSVDVIVISAACDNESITKALRYGAFDYLIKPFEFERLKTALIAYRDRVTFTRNQDMASQNELDQRILCKEHVIQLELPKGIDRSTLRLVWEDVRTRTDEGFTTKELARHLGLSRVSMRKYLDFLVKLEVLDMEIAFGAIGRPVGKYRRVKLGDNTIRPYL